MSTKTYDPKCHELAKHFLDDEDFYYGNLSSSSKDRESGALAWVIQQAVEDHLVERRSALMIHRIGTVGDKD